LDSGLGLQGIDSRDIPLKATGSVRCGLTESSSRVGIGFVVSSVMGSAVWLKPIRMMLRHRKGVLSFQNRIPNVSSPQHRCQQTPDNNYGLPGNENQHESTSGD